MPTYPDTLPAPIIADYSVTDVPNLAITELQGGPRKREQVSSHFQTTGTASVVLNKDEADTFRSLLALSNHGASWLTDTPMDTGQGLSMHRIRVSNVRWMVAGFVPGKNWKVSFSYETDVRNAFIPGPENNPATGTVTISIL